MSRAPSPEPVDIEAYVRRAQDGDASAFDALFVEMRPRLEAWVTSRLGPRLRTRLDVEDVIQEVQLAAFRDIGLYRSRGRKDDFWRWLATLVNNRIRDMHEHHFQTKKRSADRERLLHSTLRASITSPSGRARRGETHELMLCALARLSERDREIIRLCTFDGLSYREAGEILRITPENVSARISRARARLREAMHELSDRAGW